MSVQAVLVPAFIEVLLIFVLLALMAQNRMAAMRQGLKASEIALDGAGFPPKARQSANAYGNSFEMPTLFFAAVILGIVVHQAGNLFVVVEWVFLAARIGQAFVHVTTNDVRLRGLLFIAGAGATLLLWILIAYGVLIGTP
jgi:hypothetical protein